MARYLLAARSTLHGTRSRAARAAIRCCASSAASSIDSSGCAAAIASLLALALARPLAFRRRLPGVVFCSLRAVAVPRPEFLSRGRAAQIKLHVRAPTGTRIEETARLFDHVERDDPQHHSGRRDSTRSSTTSACRSAASTSPTAIPARSASADADILITLKEDQARNTRDYIEALRERLPQLFPGTTLRFPARRHRHPDPQFRLAGADRRAGHRQRADGQPRLCRASCSSAIAHSSRHRRRAHPAGVQLSEAQRRRRPHRARSTSG